MKKPWKLYNTRKIIISYTLDVPATRQCSSSLQSSLQSSVAISHKNQHVLNTFFWLILSFLIFAAPSLTILHRGMFSAFTLLISSKIFLFFQFQFLLFLSFSAVWRAKLCKGCFWQLKKYCCIETCKTWNFWLQTLKLYDSGFLIADFCRLTRVSE